MRRRRIETRIRRAGLSLIELLVVIGVIAMLAGLLLPAVQSAREAARRVLCAAHLGEIIRATHGYEASQGSFPPRQFSPDDWTRRDRYRTMSTQVVLLPYLELGSLHNALNFELRCITPADFAGANATAARTRIDGFLCPSDPLIGRGEWAGNSYRANYGVDPFHAKPGGVYGIPEDGAFVAIRPTLRAADFRDGLSQTLAYSEKPIGSGATFGFSAFRDWYHNVTVPDTGAHWLAACSRLVGDEHTSGEAGATWLLTGGIYTGFFMTAPPNSLVPDCGTPHFNGAGLFTARSYHRGGVNAAMADGSVRWFNDAISIRVWQALGTRGGSEIVD